MLPTQLRPETSDSRTEQSREAQGLVGERVERVKGVNQPFVTVSTWPESDRLWVSVVPIASAMPSAQRQIVMAVKHSGFVFGQ